MAITYFCRKCGWSQSRFERVYTRLAGKSYYACLEECEKCNPLFLRPLQRTLYDFEAVV